MITSNLRRLFGATSFMSNLCWVHFSLDRTRGDVAVEGADHWAASSSWYSVQETITSPLLTQSGLSSALTMPVMTEIGNITFIAVMTAGEAQGEAPPPRVPPRVVQPEALEHRPRPVEEVDAERDVGDEVDRRHAGPAEGGHEVAVGVAADEVGVRRAPGEVGEVEDDEEPDDDAGPAHRAAGGVGGLEVAALLVARAVRSVVHAREAVGRVDVEEEGADQPEPHQPQGDRAGQDRHEELSQELAVVVEVLGAQVHLQVPDGVGEHEPDDHQTGDRHHPLLADGGAVEGHRPGCTSAWLRVHRLGGRAFHRRRHRSISLHEPRGSLRTEPTWCPEQRRNPGGGRRMVK